jgi:hypothetical protein
MRSYYLDKADIRVTLDIGKYAKLDTYSYLQKCR